MSSKLKAVFYYDIISPFSYFYVMQRQRLDQYLDIVPVPILLGGLLRSTNNHGPGEIAAKRPHTYQYCIWLASKLALPFKFPAHHPFSTVAAQRLLVQINADWKTVERAFTFVWVEGKDPNLAWSEFCLYLGVSADTAIPSSLEVKEKLILNTNQAQSDGAFGVPSLVVNGQCFWGVDTIDWTLDFLKHPKMFDESAYQSAKHMPNGF
jgi:2-hydroxychromene-2-carboxylate isomerase